MIWLWVCCLSGGRSRREERGEGRKLACVDLFGTSVAIRRRGGYERGAKVALQAQRCGERAALIGSRYKNATESDRLKGRDIYLFNVIERAELKVHLIFPWLLQ